MPQVTTRPPFLVQRAADGFHLRRPGGPEIVIEQHQDGVTLRGDGLAHAIRTENDTVQVQSLDNPASVVTFPKMAILDNAQRVGLGVAAAMIGLPVHQLTGISPEPVYLKLASRPGLGLPGLGSGGMGRFRVTDTVRKLDGTFVVQTGQSARRTVSLPRDDEEAERRAYTTQLSTKTGSPLDSELAFHKMTGNQFGETFATSVAEIWRRAGKPGDAGEAIKVAFDVFGRTYEQRPEDDGWYRPSEHAEPLMAALSATSDPHRTWSVLSEAIAQSRPTEEIVKALRLPTD